MKEATIVYTAQFTNIVTDQQDLALIENNPDKCDGDFCPMDCDHCPWADEAMQAQEEEDE